MTQRRDVRGAHLRHPRHWPAWAGVATLGLLYWLPRGWRDRLGAAIGDWQYRRNPKRRGTVELNLSLCLPDWTEAERSRLAREHFHAYGRAVLDHPVFWWDRSKRLPRDVCRVHGGERIRELQRQGRPVILVEPHTVAVDVGGTGLSAYAALSIMGNRLSSAVLDRVVHSARARYGATVFRRADGLRPLVRALRRGSVLYYLPDEDFGDANSVFAPFFGQPKATLKTVGRLAERTGAAVLPMYVYYKPEERVYEAIVEEPLADFPSGDPVADATRVNAAMEQCIRKRPEAYLWSFRLFRHRPDGTLRRYPTYDRRTRARRRRRRKRRQSATR